MAWPHKIKIRSPRLSKELRPSRRPERKKRKRHTKGGITNERIEKAVFQLRKVIPNLLPVQNRKILTKSLITITTKMVISLEIVRSQKR